ncbi:MAG: ABC transporter permease [Mycoplasmataceae bacterium]|nr:ABC transporter permease [Mycoplasmataceae bacterium]
MINDDKYKEFLDESDSKIAYVNVETEYSKQNLDSSLKNNLFRFVELERSSGISSLSGKQKRMSADVATRFFKNYFASISLVVFLTILLISIIAPLASQFGSNKPILNLTPEFISNLPPSYAPIVTEILTVSQLENIIKVLGNDAVTTRELTPGGDWLVTYDKYTLINKTLGELSDKTFDFTTILGTTQEGFDIWTRTWAATRDSLLLSILVALTETTIGILIGSYIGFHAGTWIDNVFTRLIDIVKNVPSIIWFLLLISLFNDLNFGTLFLSLILIGWTAPVYQTRLWMITIKDQEYILASKSIGASTNRQIFIHALPAIIGKLATSFVWRIVIVIFFVSSLAFLGFIPYGGEPNLGTILNEARSQVENNIWILLLPSVILLLTSLSTQFIANGLHDALDPKIGGK